MRTRDATIGTALAFGATALLVMSSVAATAYANRAIDPSDPGKIAFIRAVRGKAVRGSGNESRREWAATPDGLERKLFLACHVVT